MRFVVASRARGGANGGGRARAGSLYSGSVVVETPSLLISTRKGLPNFISRDLIDSLPNSHLLHVSPVHFIECPSLKTISSIGGLHQMVGLHGSIFVASARDSIESLPESGATNKFGASFETPSGRRLVRPPEYMNLISSLKPNLWVSLADEVPAWVSEKRNKVSVDRTIRWLDDCLSLDKAGGATILGSVVGGSAIEERKRCATEVAGRNVSGEKLQEKFKLYWTPCAAHCLNLMLKDLAKIPQVKRALSRAMQATGFIYSHTKVINIMKTFTNKRDTVRPTKTRFATSYISLQSIHKAKNQLRVMFADDVWKKSSFAREEKGKVVEKIVFMTSFWNDVFYALKLTTPLVRVLKLVDNEKKSAMGYICEAMDRAKKAIIASFGGEVNVDKYKKAFEYIDKRWEVQMHRPLHAAGYYLNPAFFYDNPNIQSDEEVQNGLYDVITQLVELILHDVMLKKFSTYRNAGGLFGHKLAKDSRNTKSPGFWIGGFGLGESMEERPALLNVVMDVLPEEKLRYVSGLALPEEVLQGVAAGIDLFDSTYIYHLTLGGFALIFPLDTIKSNIVNSKLSDVDGGCTKINLRATVYRKDTSPIVDNCTCFTCQNHTRAYINHLLNVHEMLAQILLEIHNTHHYMGFFRLIREAIYCGKFEIFRQRFIEGRRAHITSAAVCL